MSIEEGKAVVNWQEKMGAVAKLHAAAEVVSGKFVSFRGGQFSYNDIPFPGNQAEFIIIAACHENRWYENKFNADAIETPVCFAFGVPDVETGLVPHMVPHDKSKRKQHETCKGCPLNAWGSDPDRPRGKACKEIRRLALLPVDCLKEPDKIIAAVEAYAAISVTNVSRWAAYVHQLAARGYAPWGVVTRISVRPDPRNQFQVNYELAATISDNDVLGALYQKHLASRETVAFPYEESENALAAATPAKPSKIGRK